MTPFPVLGYNKEDSPIGLECRWEKLFFIFQGIPSLCFQLKLLSVTGNECATKFLFSDVSDEFDSFHLGNLLVIGNGNGKQQFVIFASIKGAGGDVHIQLFSHDCCLVVDGQMFFVDAASHFALSADVHQFTGKSVADIHHGSRFYACFG